MFQMRFRNSIWWLSSWCVTIVCLVVIQIQNIVDSMTWRKTVKENVDCKNENKHIFIIFFSQLELTGQSLFDFIHPKDINKVKEQLSSSELNPRQRVVDAASKSPLKTVVPPGNYVNLLYTLFLFIT